MNSFIKKNINNIISSFILLQPILDLITGLCLHVLNINFTIGIIIKLLFAVSLMGISIFTYKNKKVLIPYLLLIIYACFYLTGMIIYKDSSLFIEIQNLFKTFYFPVVLLSLYSIKDEIRISKNILYTSIFTYILLIFIPTILGVGYNSYEITKAGTLGFYNSANEISGMISILTPIIFLVFWKDKNIFKKTLLTVIYLLVILMIGTKTPLLSLIITSVFTCFYIWIKCIKNKNYKIVLLSILGILLAFTGLLLIIPKTNFYKNIETHLNYLEVDNVLDIFKKEELVDHFIFSQRLTFLHNKKDIYDKSPIYEKVFGTGYMYNNEETKLIEMDYFDIFYSHGIVGFLLYFSIILPIVFNALKEKQKLTYERYMLLVSLLLIIVLSFFTGHIIVGPSVSLLSAIIIISIIKRNKKDLLFAAVNLDIGGIEKALLNLVNRIDLNKYNVTVLLEEKKGIFIKDIKEGINLKEIKVNNNKNVIIRKLINYTTKYIYKVYNFKNYDFSCCYATYSYSCSKLSLISSDNTCLFIHSDYRRIYKDDKDFYNFFESRNIKEYKNIIFVSKENRKGFIEKYKDLKDKCLVFNNFIDTEEIIRLSKEKIKEEKSSNKLFVFVGRLDDTSKKLSRQINLVKNIKNIDLWIIGDGPDKDRYVKEVKDNNLTDRIKFLGKQKNPFKYMKEADYIILTSDYEGFPVTYLEAITLNKNIITTYPTSDDIVDIRKYGHVISKDEEIMVKEVKDILRLKNNVDSIDLEDGQIKRMNNLEEIFNKVY